MISIYNALRDELDRTAALDQAFRDFAHRANEGPPGGPAEYPYEYVVVVAQKRN